MGPAACTVQCAAPTVTLKDATLSWNAVDGASAYLVYRNGELLAITDATSYAVTETAATWTVRAANAMGGLGLAGKAVVPTAIRSLCSQTEENDAPYYNLAGQRVSKNAKGLLIHNGKKVIK